MTGEGGRDIPLSLSRVTGVCEGDLLSGERLTAGAVVERESFPFCYRSSALVPTYGAGQGSKLFFFQTKGSYFVMVASRRGRSVVMREADHKWFFPLKIVHPSILVLS